MKAKSKQFQGMFSSSNKLREKAEQFMTEIGPQHVISVTHSGKIIVVWYWDGGMDSAGINVWS